MSTKFISLATAIVTLDVYLQSQLHSSDPLFLVVSNNTAVNMLMVVLAAAAIAVSFRSRFKSWYGYTAVSALAALFIAFGAMGLFFSGFSARLWMIFLPLNYMLLLSCGVVLGVAALSYKHAPRPESVRLPSLPRLALPFKSVFPVPKISHSPFAGRTSVTSPRLGS